MLKDIFFMFSTSVALRVLRLLVNVLLISQLGRYLGEAGTGRLLAAQATVAVLLCFAELGFARISVREQVRQRDERAVVLGSIFYFRLLVGFVLYGVLWGISSASDPADRPLLWIYGLLLPTHAFSELGAALEADNHTIRSQWAQWWGFMAGAAVTFIGIMLELPLLFFPLSYVLECWLASVIQWRSFHTIGGRMRDWRWQLPRSLMLMREALPELASQAALMLLFRLDMLMVKGLHGAEEAGVYGAAVRISETLYFMPMLLASMLLARLTTAKEASSESYQKGLVHYHSATWAMGLGGAAVLSLTAGPITALLWGGRFTGSAEILVVHAWAFIPYALGVARTQHLTIEGRLWANLPSVLIALVANAALNWWWIPEYGGLGAAWATLLSYTLAWVLTSHLIPDLRESGQLQLRGLRGLLTTPGKWCQHWLQPS
jgi:O-antigen/teichoic acid export membrane protein